MSVGPIATCWGCGAPIRFIDTAKGKRMPVNAEPVEFYTFNGHEETFVTDAGETVKGWKEDAPSRARHLTGYVPHWATCTSPQDFRQGIKRPRASR